MKVILLCSFSNAIVREHLSFVIPKTLRWLYKLVRKHDLFSTSDYGVWNTNAIKEFERIDDVDLHVIAPFAFLKNRIQEFNHNGIHYHFYRDENSTFLKMMYRQVVRSHFDNFKHNRHLVRRLISSIKPDIVHLIGAENPQYSLSLLDISTSIPTIVQLQTLLNDPDFKSNFPISESSYLYLSSVERKVLLRADYIGTKVDKFIKIIRTHIKPNATIINTDLAVGEYINPPAQEAKFDFVYFASNINKACDLALEAFGKAYQRRPTITLDIIGGYSSDYRSQLDSIIKKYGIANAVTFEGRLATHEDVIRQIRMARFALLPLKIDIASCTIREAMSNGLPVITTDTGELGTQLLNKEYDCVLISPKSDCQSIANNMIELLDDTSLADTLRQNSYKRQQDNHNNKTVVNGYVNAYRKILWGKYEG